MAATVVANRAVRHMLSRMEVARSYLLGSPATRLTPKIVSVSV
jgi:hypothetical protein